MKQVDIARESVADRVRQVLMDRIIDGTYRSGTRLVEMDIAREFRTSQAPVREALRALEAAHFLETEPYRGTRVRQVGEREWREAFQVRAVLEKLAVQLGAARLRERLRDLRAEADATLSAAKAGDVTRFLQHNIRFHQMIVEASDNAVLQRTWAALVFTVGARARAARTADDMTAVAKEHREIVDAIARGDAKAAGRLLRRHGEVLAERHVDGEPPPSQRIRRRASQPA